MKYVVDVEHFIWFPNAALKTTAMMMALFSPIMAVYHGLDVIWL